MLKERLEICRYHIKALYLNNRNLKKTLIETFLLKK